MRFLFRVILLICLLASTASAASTKARLILPSGPVQPGTTILAGIELRMEDRWHTYWRNPGESGGATEIQWELPSGITAGPIQWPVPEKYEFFTEINYAYHGQPVLLVPLNVAGDAKPGEFEIKGIATWIECKEECVPGRATLRGKLMVGEGQGGIPAEIETAKSKLPQSGEKLKAWVKWDKSVGETSRSILIEWNSAQPLKNPDFYPYESDGFDVLPKTEVLKNDGGEVQIRKTVKKFKGEWPKEISGIIVEDSAQGQDSPAYEVQLSFKETGAGSAPGKGIPGIPADKESLAKMLLFAFLGGLILNVMPCVLPVIALKVLGFVQQSKEEPGHVKKLGLVYMVGVLVSFAALAALVIGVQQAGKAAGWGMQFQDPRFVVVMATLITLVALNLFGVFEVNVGGRTMAVAAGAASKEGAAGSFFNGVLATVLATPCMAPFLATAIGFAFTQTPFVILLVLLTVGFGLALPYVVLCWNPRLMKLLPKPGAWMEKFKIALGFPLLATAIWLLSLTSDYFGSDGPLWIGLFLTCIAAAAWIFGSFVQRGTGNRAIAWVFVLFFAVAGYVYALEKELEWRAPVAVNTTATASETAWSPELVEKLRAEGRPVLVDFTANWCLTCKVNKRTSLEIESVREKLKAINGAMLIADYTRPSDAITAELKRYDRAGVPLVLVFPPKASEPPIVLPTVLTPTAVLEALDKASN